MTLPDKNPNPGPIEFDPYAELQLTQVGMYFVVERQHARQRHMDAKDIGQEAVHAVQELDARIGEDNTVLLSHYEFEDTIGPLYRLGIKVVEQIVPPPAAQEPISRTPPVTISPDASESQFYADPQISPDIRSDDVATPGNSAPATREDAPK